MKKLVIGLVIVCLIGFAIPIKVFAEEYAPASIIKTINENFENIKNAGKELHTSLLLNIVGGVAIASGTYLYSTGASNDKALGTALAIGGFGFQIASIVFQFKATSDLKNVTTMVGTAF